MEEKEKEKEEEEEEEENYSRKEIMLSDEPYLEDEVRFKSDPEEYIWQAELSDYTLSDYTLSTEWFDDKYPDYASRI